jgi:carboxymethylenebutenolidase
MASRSIPTPATGSSTTTPPADRTALLMVLNVVSGTRYHEPSAQDARRRIVAFFDAHLKRMDQ